MSQFPSLPFFTDAYIADTMHLTNEEHGAYLRLLMFAWRSPDCRLPDDDARLARMLGLTAKKWAAIKPAVMAFWSLEDGHFSQKRLAREHQFVTAKVEKKRAAGEKGGRPKSLEKNDQGKASGSEIEKQNESEPKAPTPTPTLEANASMARDTRQRVVEAFRELAPNVLTPDTNRVVIWLSQGFDPDLIVAVIREILVRKPNVAGLSYFDRPIAEAAGRRAAKPATKPDSGPSPDQDRRHRLRMALDHFRGEWREGSPEAYRPGSPACSTDPAIIEEARLQAVAERGEGDGKEAA